MSQDSNTHKSANDPKRLLEIAFEANADYLSHVRHEFRTPLNQILGYGEMLEEDAESAGQASVVSDLQKIQKASRRLLELVDTHLSTNFLKPLPSASTESPEGNRSSDSSDVSPHSIEKSIEESMGDSPDAAHPMIGRILVVDDQPANRDVLVRRLQRNGLQTSVAENGAEALSLIGTGSYDLVLLDIMMPIMDGYETLVRLKSNEATRHIPVIMISALDELESVIRCIEAGAEDYLPKPFDPTLLRARINACLEKKSLRDKEQNYLQQILQTQKRLTHELEEAEEYLRSLFPVPAESPLQVTWKHQSCSELGGDALGYHWIDETHFAMYVLDVCGHGVGASLLSATAINVLRSGSLPVSDMRQPAEVLGTLNNMFLIEQQNNRFFTIWYGVFNIETRTLTYGGAGHPAALLFTPGAGHPSLHRLKSTGAIIGIIEGMDYQQLTCSIPEGSHLIVLTDGCFEVIHGDGSMMDAEVLDHFLIEHIQEDDMAEAWFLECQRRRGDTTLDDDFTLLRIRF